MKVLLAWDGNRPFEDECEDLRRAGYPDDLELVVLIAIEPPDTLADATVQVLAHAARLQERFPTWRVRGIAAPGPVASAITHEADEGWVDGIIVGAHQRGALARLLVGSVSLQVVQHAACTVRLVPHDYHPAASSPSVLIVGYDGSPNAAAVIDAVVGRRWPAGTRIRLVCAVDPVIMAFLGYLVPPLAHWADRINSESMGGVEEMLAPAVARLEAAGLEVETVVREGRPSDVLMKCADESGADAILVGGRGLGLLERLLVGSVSAALATQARCPVEVVRCARRGGSRRAADNRSEAWPAIPAG
jgi:nucleotide-binding universal stress UspA family protein